MRVVILRGRVNIGHFCFEGCSEDSMYLFFTFFLDTLFLYMRSCDHLLTCIVLYSYLYLCSEDSMYLFFSFLFFLFRYIILVYEVMWPFIDIHCTLLLFIFVYVFLSPTPSCVVSFPPLYTCFLYLYAIYYFCFTQRCLDKFCLKCFRNTGCQNLLAINSLLTKFFKSLC